MTVAVDQDEKLFTSLTQAAEQRLIAAVPQISSAKVLPSKRAFLLIKLEHGSSHHVFRLKRDRGKWVVREWTVDGAVRASSHRSAQFEDLIARSLGEVIRPKIDIAEMRCPEDPRKLFGKVILQGSGKKSSALIEFSCPVCKRANSQVTMHLFDTNGRFVKSEAIEPWVKAESQPWFRNNNKSNQEVP